MKTKLLEIAQALDLGSIDDKKARTLLLDLLGVSNSPCFGVVEMAVHDFFTRHNSFQEITDQKGEAYTMEFLEAHKELLGISDDY